MVVLDGAAGCVAHVGQLPLQAHLVARPPVERVLLHRGLNLWENRSGILQGDTGGREPGLAWMIHHNAQLPSQF